LVATENPHIWLKVAGDVDAKAADLYAINVSL